ncbi:MAG: TQO small subunit DoxD [Candidatus Methylomirabilis sp.]
MSLGLFRMIFGLLWLDLALQKAPWVIQDGQRFGWLYGYIWKEINNPTFDFYKAFLQGVVLPNFTFFGYMTFFTEIALGLSLLLGLLTVLGGLGGALWQLNIALGSYSVPGEWYWIWFLLIAPHLVFAQSRAGRSVGLDRLLWDYLRRSQESGHGIRRLVLALI